MTARRGLLLLFVLALVAMAVPTTQADSVMQIGYASAYAPGVMEATVRYRIDNDVWRNPPPVDWYTVTGYIAAMDCSRVGEVTMLTDPGGREHRVLIADCAGADGHPDRFAEANIIVELDWRLWLQLTGIYGRPLKVGLK